MDTPIQALKRQRAEYKQSLAFTDEQGKKEICRMVKKYDRAIEYLKLIKV